MVENRPNPYSLRIDPEVMDIKRKWTYEKTNIV